MRLRQPDTCDVFLLIRLYADKWGVNDCWLLRRAERGWWSWSEVANIAEGNLDFWTNHSWGNMVLNLVTFIDCRLEAWVSLQGCTLVTQYFRAQKMITAFAVLTEEISRHRYHKILFRNGRGIDWIFEYALVLWNWAENLSNSQLRGELILCSMNMTSPKT